MAKPKRMTTSELRAMINNGATRDQVPVTGSTIVSTRDSASIAYLERIQRLAITAKFKADQLITARQKAELRTQQDAIDRATANSISNANIQQDRVEIVNSQIINTPTGKYLDQFADRGSIITPYYDPSIYVVHGVLENNNSPIVETPIVNFSGIGKNQTTETQKPSNSTTTVQNNKNNASTTPVNKTNLIANVNLIPSSNTELNELADRKRLSDSYPSHFSQVDTDAGEKNYLKIGGIAAVAGILAVIAIKR
jgi:hypothetical protein